MALLGADVEAAARWAQHSGGKIPTAALPTLKALRKRLRRSSGVDPRVVLLRGAGEDELPHEARSPAELADVLDPGADADQAAIVLWLADPGTPALEQSDAVYAPDLESAQAWVTASGRGLAIVDAIVEAREPRQRPAVIADLALATLPRGTEERDES